MDNNSSEIRNVVLAIVLSIIVIFGWSAFFAPEPVVRHDNVEDTKNSSN